MSHVLVKRILFYLTITGILYACDQRYDIVEAVNEPPVSEFPKITRLTAAVRDRTLYDSARFGKEETNYYNFTLSFSDANKNITRILIDVSDNGTLELVTKDGNKSVNSEQNLVELLPANTDTIPLRYHYKDIGFHKNIIVFYDVFKRTSRLDVALQVFPNLPPHLVAQHTIEQDDLVLDLSKSYDLDNRYIDYKTEIVGFEITISNSVINYKRTFQSTQPTIRNPLPEKGKYKVEVKAVDNDQMWSKTKVFTIQY